MFINVSALCTALPAAASIASGRSIFLLLLPLLCGEIVKLFDRLFVLVLLVVRQQSVLFVFIGLVSQDQPMTRAQLSPIIPKRFFFQVFNPFSLRACLLLLLLPILENCPGRLPARIIATKFKKRKQFIP